MPQNDDIEILSITIGGIYISRTSTNHQANHSISLNQGIWTMTKQGS